jgi:calcium-binding protein CML
MYRQLHANEKHPEVPLDLFAKWINSRHSELAAKLLTAAKDLKWGEMAPLIVYANPDEEPEVTEERFVKAKAAAKGGFVVSTFAIKASYQTTKMAYKIAKPVTTIAVKTTAPIVKTTLTATSMVTSALDATVGNYNKAGSAMFASVDAALFVEFTDEDKAARAAYKMLDENKDKLLQRREMSMIEKCCGLVFTELQLDEMYKEMMGEVPIASEGEGSGSEVETAQGRLVKRTENGVSKSTWTAWYSSNSMYASRIRRESLWAVDRERAEAAGNHRSTLVEAAALEALDQKAAWLPQKDFDDVDPHDLIGLTVDIKGKGNGHGWVQDYGKKGHEVVREEDGKVIYVTLNKKTKFAVLSQEYYDNYLFNSLEDAMEDWEAEHDNPDESGSESESGSGTESETSGDAMQKSVDGESGSDAETSEGEGGPVVKKKKVKKLSKKEAAAEAAAAEAEAERQREVVRQELLTAKQGIVTREDLSTLGSLMGVALTKNEIDKAMQQMDPAWTPAGGDSRHADAGEDESESQGVAKPGAEGTGTIPFKAFNAWFEEIDLVTGEPLEYTAEKPRSEVLVKIKLAKQAMEARASLSKLGKLKSMGISQVDEPPTAMEIEEALFEELDDNAIAEINWDEFTYLAKIADVEMEVEELEEAWKIMDPEDTDIVVKQTFLNWYNSDSVISDKVKADDNGALLELGAAYKKANKQSTGKFGVNSMIKSADAGKVVGMLGSQMNRSTGGMIGSADAAQKKKEPRIIYKEDVEQAAREKASVEALVQDDAWRDGLTVLSEMDREDLVGARIDVETYGKGNVVATGKGRAFMVEFDPGTPISKKKMAMDGDPPVKVKLPNKKFGFTVLSDDYVKEFIEQAVNKAISKWAQKESKIRGKVEAAAKAKVLAKKGAWKPGTDIDDPDDIIDCRVTIKGYGKGTIVEYDEEGQNEKKARWGKHTIEFDSGKVSQLQMDKGAGLQFKILNERYVEDIIKAELRIWQEARRKLTPEELEEREQQAADKAKQGKIMKLRDVKNKMAGKSQMMTTADREEDLDAQLNVLQELFDNFDENGDGILDRDEFDVLCFEMGFRGTNSQLDEAWTEIDENKNNAIDFKELSDFFTSDLLMTIAGSLLRNQIQARIISYREDMILLRRLFVKADADNNGHIDMEEFETLAAELNFDGTGEELATAFQEIDTDGTGFVEFPELKDFYIKNEIDLGDSAAILQELMVTQLDADKVDGDTLRRVFAKHDNDGNGYIDAFEFDVLVEELGYNGKVDDMKDLFKQMDKDNNGLIDWQEFVAYFGSAAKGGGKIVADLRRNLFNKFTDQALDLRDLRKVFDKFDKDGDGQIEPDEFYRAAKNLGWSGTEEELDESFMRADADGNGTIEWPEFRDWYKSKNPDAVVKMMQEMEGSDENAIAMLKELFDKHDSDSNGELSMKEFFKMAKSIKLATKKAELERMFRDMDVDKGGTIDFGEFKDWYENNTDGEILKRVKGAMGNDKKSMKRRQTLKVMFGRIDSNNSGEIDSPEMLQLALDLGLEMTLADMNTIFSEIDLDGNGAVSFEEFSEWFLLKGGKGDILRSRLKAWYKQISTTSADDVQSMTVSVGFDRGRALAGTKRVDGKITYFFSRISGAYSEISQFAEQQLTVEEKTGFSTIDKLVYLQQTQLFNSMELGHVLRVAQVCEQINMEEGEVLFEDGDEGHAAYFIMNGSMTLTSGGVEVPVEFTDKPFGEQTFISAQNRAGSMIAAEDTILLCLFQVDMARLFTSKLVDENSFMHALGGLVVGSLRSNYAQLEEASSSGTVGQDLSLEVARAGWTYDTADFVYAKKSKGVQGASGGAHGHLDERVQAMIKEKALNAAILNSTAYSTVEKVILLKQCKIFATAPDRALSEVAELVKMIRLPPGVLLYKEGDLGFDSFVVCSGQVKLTKHGNLIGLREKGSINGATCLIAAGDPRSATVTTTRDTLVMNITYDDFDSVMQNEPELRKGMMTVLMDRLADSYQRLNAVRRLEGRVGYFHEFRKELRLDVRNLRLNAPRPDDYKSFIDEREDDEEDGAGYGGEAARVGGGAGGGGGGGLTHENPVFIGKKKARQAGP